MRKKLSQPMNNISAIIRVCPVLIPGFIESQHKINNADSDIKTNTNNIWRN